ncbi:Uncharacterised protein [Mycobacteroides abscessus subsp. abscessus]|nr:Uncharacterised protein [Mycobacteroides abscessus subsp. abscessus]
MAQAVWSMCHACTSPHASMFPSRQHATHPVATNAARCSERSRSTSRSVEARCSPSGRRSSVSIRQPATSTTTSVLREAVSMRSGHEAERPGTLSSVGSTSVARAMTNSSPRTPVSIEFTSTPPSPMRTSGPPSVRGGHTQTRSFRPSTTHRRGRRVPLSTASSA